MLRIESVTGGYGRTTVLHEVSLEVPTGAAVALMGHNGAGKTTLLKAAVGLVRAKSGRVLLDGEDVTGLRPSARVKRGLGYVPQGQQSFGDMTALENLQLVGDRAGISEMLDLFPALKDLLGRRAGLLSGGQRQQLSIARTLLTRPRLLILDEPTEGIQPNVVAEIERVIAELTGRGDLTVLLVEQHVGFALRTASAYYILESGRITARGDGGSEAHDHVRSQLAV
ncbi:ATP-binding cassette domain-containing protein [Nocardioides albus]|uniref:Urea transport system ATP-binding protein n=1 Tax=Nocardioides albus TaxID=1841 RepID=A0A7W5A542_9ACTN|nr:ATP-binding cassette domain-containing protein [Nocardioides albus]MBB3089837.1 urea transport system ATP-binding protein [Nocardioides albus]GGU35968.1 ABC transporter ATP-binding protein [Nocardioides albus]